MFKLKYVIIILLYLYPLMLSYNQIKSLKAVARPVGICSVDYESNKASLTGLPYLLEQISS